VKNEYRVTKSLYLRWTFEGMFQKVKLIILGVFLLIIAGLIYFGLKDGVNPFLLLIAALCLYWVFVKSPLATLRKYKMLQKKYGAKSWMRTVEFTDEVIRLSEGTAEAELDYAELQDIWEKKDRILLVFDGLMVVRLYRDAFVDTDWESCRAHIERMQELRKEQKKLEAAAAEEEEDYDEDYEDEPEEDVEDEEK